jgi:hypothetical protein
MINYRKAMAAAAGILTPVILGAWLVSCSQPLDEAVVGKWRKVAVSTNAAAAAVSPAAKPAATTFEFRHNGVLVTQGSLSPDIVIPGVGDKPLTNRYTLLDEQTIRIVFGRGRAQERSVTMLMAPSGNRLVLTETNVGLNRTSALSGRTNAALTKTNFILVKTNAPAIDWGGPRGVLTLERIE